jgi:hypothetical protein
MYYLGAAAQLMIRTQHMDPKVEAPLKSAALAGEEEAKNRTADAALRPV